MSVITSVPYLRLWDGDWITEPDPAVFVSGFQMETKNCRESSYGILLRGLWTQVSGRNPDGNIKFPIVLITMD